MTDYEKEWLINKLLVKDQIIESLKNEIRKLIKEKGQDDTHVQDTNT